jgi:omega-amidase
MKISLVQSDIIWENKSANLLHYESLFSGLAGKTDLVLLPEMCTTGFSMQAEALAETPAGETIASFKRMAANHGFAIAGSYIGKDVDYKEAACYNRGFFIQPDGKTHFYDKKHLFRMGEESDHYTAGKEKVLISYMGWNIRLAVCYDLRFPVWLRNTSNEYDLLLITANWPNSRQHVWTSLLTARAIENQAYVCGVNRTGTDGMGLLYSGGSRLINAYGKALSDFHSEGEQVQTLEIKLDELHRFREKFPVWADADAFYFYG